MTRGDAPASEMTIREAFAMAAMQGLVSNHVWYEHLGQANELVADQAVELADALLAELERTKDGQA